MKPIQQPAISLQRRNEIGKPKGGTRKIADIMPSPCAHPNHEPYGNMYLSPGRYEHVCPGCDRRFEFTVAGLM